MSKKLIFLFTIFLIFLISCSTSLKTNKEIELFHRIINVDTTTIITNLYKIDTLKIKGKWQRIIYDNHPSHGINLKNNDIIISFFPYKKNRNIMYNKKFTNEIFFKRFESDQLNNWDNLNFKYRKLKSGINYSVFFLDNKYTLIGSNDKYTFHISFYEPNNISENEVSNFLINLFNTTE